MTDRNLCLLAVSLLAGVVYGRMISEPEIRTGTAGVVCLLTFYVLLLMYTGAGILKRYGRQAWGSILIRSSLCLLLFAAGILHYRSELEKRQIPERLFAEGDSITVQGQIYKKEEKYDKSVYYLKDTWIFSGSEAYPGNGILIYSSNASWQLGNQLQVTGGYEPFQCSRNEGNFHEKQYYHSKKIEFRVNAQREILLSSKESRYRVILADLREKLKQELIICLPEKEAGVLINMTLGEKELLDSDIKELYQQAGISHVLAISGLHVSIFGMGAFGILTKLKCPRKPAALLSMGIVYSFGLLSGMELSTVRAVLMFLLMMAGQMMGYSYDSVTALALSGMIQIWGNPFVLDYAGFLFSYGAVLGVTVVAKIIQQAGKEREAEREAGKEEKRKRGESEKRAYAAKGLKRKGEEKKQKRNNTKIEALRESDIEQENSLGKSVFHFLRKSKTTLMDTIFVSTCIQLMTLPLSLYFYYETPVYSILTNACILPFMGILLFLGIMGAVAGLFFRGIARLVLFPAGWLLQANEAICRLFLSLPCSTLLTGKPSIELLAGYYMLLAAVLYMLHRRKKPQYLVGIAAALVMLVTIRGKKEFEINVLDVGQGDGIYIQTEEAQFFIDGGSSDIKQAGKYRILPFLKSRGISRIKGWIVSHADNDHISGLVELLEMGYAPEYLIVAEGMCEDEAKERLFNAAKQAGCGILELSPGEQFGADGILFTALYPEPEKAADQNRNGASLVLSMEYEGFTALFTGDIAEEQEQEILESGCLSQYGISNISFYKAAHHGSNGSNSQEFLEQLSPSLTVVSCGIDNSYGHPGTEAVERMEAAGSRMFYTMESGQVTVRWKEKQIWVSPYLTE